MIKFIRENQRCAINLLKTYLGVSNNSKNDKINEIAQLEIYKDSLNHEFLVVSGVL